MDCFVATLLAMTRNVSIRIAGFEDFLAHQDARALDPGVDETHPVGRLVDVARDLEHVETAVAFERFDRRQHFDVLLDVDRLAGFIVVVKAQQQRRFRQRIGRAGRRLRVRGSGGDISRSVAIASFVDAMSVCIVRVAVGLL